MTLPDSAGIRDLLGWGPDLGVVSVYLPIDHGDRGQGWRTALRDGLRGVLSELDPDGDHDRRAAVRATAERLMERWPDDGRPPDGRGLVGFVEVSKERGSERVLSSQVAPRAPHVVLSARPFVRPLVEMIDDNRPIGVVAVSGEHARVMEWTQGELTELEALEILTTGDWRERKARRPADPATAQATSSSGRDQHQQRVDANRDRFISEVAAKLAEMTRERGWEELTAFGDERYLGELERAVNGTGREIVVHHEHKNLVPASLAEVEERVTELVPDYNRARELRLIERAADAAASGGRGALGAAESAQAVVAGRAEHLILDGSREFDPAELEPVLAASAGGERYDPAELLVERALETDATVTPVEGEAAERLAAHGGIAAILRY